MVFLYGYDVYTAPVEIKREADVTTKIILRGHELPYRPMSSIIGPVIESHAPLIPDSNIANIPPSVSVRVGCTLLPVLEADAWQFIHFCQKFIVENFDPVPCDADTSFEHWIENRLYSGARKRQLAELRKKFDISYTTLLDQHLAIKSFQKFENYSEFKPSRTINSRDDIYKTQVGPIFSLVDHQIFARDWFIKTVPLTDRPQFLNCLFEGERNFYVTDYTSYESLFRTLYLEHIELFSLRWFTQLLPEGEHFCDLVRRASLGMNTCYYRDVTAKVEGRRMSGEMNTSSGNGLMNCCIIHYLCQLKGGTYVKGVFEGDDGLTATDAVINVDDFTKIGIRCKLEEVDSIHKASFCGMVFHPDDLATLTDPRDVLHSFGWCNKRYVQSNLRTRMSLLKSKSMSFLYQYAGCPIIYPLALRLYRLTESVSINRVVDMCDYWDKIVFDEIKRLGLKKLMNLEIGFSSRLLFEEMYGITVSQQLLFEAECSQMQIYHVFDPLAHSWLHDDSRSYMFENFLKPFFYDINSSSRPVRTHNLQWKCLAVKKNEFSY